MLHHGQVCTTVLHFLLHLKHLVSRHILQAVRPKATTMNMKSKCETTHLQPPFYPATFLFFCNFEHAEPSCTTRAAQTYSTAEGAEPTCYIYQVLLSNRSPVSRFLLSVKIIALACSRCLRSGATRHSGVSSCLAPPPGPVATGCVAFIV